MVTDPGEVLKAAASLAQIKGTMAGSGDRQGTETETGDKRQGTKTGDRGKRQETETGDRERGQETETGDRER